MPRFMELSPWLGSYYTSEPSISMKKERCFCNTDILTTIAANM